MVERHLRDVLENAEPEAAGDREARGRPEPGMRPAAWGWPDAQGHTNTGVPWCSPKNRMPLGSRTCPQSHPTDARCCAWRSGTARPPSSASPSGSRPGRKWVPSTRKMQSLVKSEGLHTVCQEAGCPNIYECWEDREATFLIGGDQCTRRCDFCQIDTGKPAGAGPRRAAPRRRVRGHDGPELRHDHRRRPRRPGGRRRLAVRRDRAPDPRADGGARGRPHQGRAARSPTSTPCPSSSPRSSPPAPRCSRTTSRRCRGSSSGSAPASATSARSKVITRGPRGRPGHQVQPDPRHGRDPRGGQRGAAASCTTRAAS